MFSYFNTLHTRGVVIIMWWVINHIYHLEASLSLKIFSSVHIPIPKIPNTAPNKTPQANAIIIFSLYHTAKL